MTKTQSKIAGYIEHRVAGATPDMAGRLAGYAESGMKVTVSRLEQRDDVRSALRKAKRASNVPAKRGQRRKPEVEELGGDVLHSPLDPWRLKDHYASPLDLMRDVMNNSKAPVSLRIQCAKDAMPYCHARKEGSKKEEKEAAGKKGAAGGRFPTMSAPTKLQRVA